MKRRTVIERAIAASEKAYRTWDGSTLSPAMIVAKRIAFELGYEVGWRAAKRKSKTTTSDKSTVRAE